MWNALQLLVAFWVPAVYSLQNSEFWHIFGGNYHVLTAFLMLFSLYDISDRFGFLLDIYLLPVFIYDQLAVLENFVSLFPLLVLWLLITHSLFLFLPFLVFLFSAWMRLTPYVVKHLNRSFALASRYGEIHCFIVFVPFEHCHYHHPGLSLRILSCLSLFTLLVCYCTVIPYSESHSHWTSFWSHVLWRRSNQDSTFPYLYSLSSPLHCFWHLCFLHSRLASLID